MDAVRSQRSFNILHEPTFVKVDVFTKIGPLENEEFERAGLVTIPVTNRQARVATVEYNIIAKLRWYLQSNCQLSQQLRDVNAMITIRRDSLDKDYIQHWATVFGLEKILAEIPSLDSL